MTTATIKTQITKALSSINDKPFLEALYTIIHDRAEKMEYELNVVDKEILDERRKNYKSGKATTYSITEVRKKVMKNLTA